MSIFPGPVDTKTNATKALGETVCWTRKELSKKGKDNPKPSQMHSCRRAKLFHCLDSSAEKAEEIAKRKEAS
ncbi:hypothetical protein MLD38_028221 [Melastoma candidum]|uniref:Uncharacterized protein n=1 Tax=Melastoma candidum TaxID=119954 RepID=A0ACB9N0G4_9MYRT|nr:hypothetical protein MLD38_028221 [Melastoma candidum]